MLATLQGIEAVKAVLEASPTSPSPVITIRENKIERSSLVDAVRITKSVAEAIGNKDFDTAIKLRDSEFKDYHRSYINVATEHHPKMVLPEQKVRSLPLIEGLVLTRCSKCALPSSTLALRPAA
jgi:6-phosphofructokinase 1